MFFSSLALTQSGPSQATTKAMTLFDLLNNEFNLNPSHTAPPTPHEGLHYRLKPPE